MSKRFGRNQKRKLLARVAYEQRITSNALARWRESEDKFSRALQDQLAKGHIPLEVKHFIGPDQRSVIMHAIFDEQRANLHYQHAISPNDLRIQRDDQERERFAMYLGRAIADRIADAYAARETGTSRAA